MRIDHGRRSAPPGVAARPPGRRAATVEGPGPSPRGTRDVAARRVGRTRPPRNPHPARRRRPRVGAARHGPARRGPAHRPGAVRRDGPRGCDGPGPPAGPRTRLRRAPGRGRGRRAARRGAGGGDRLRLHLLRLRHRAARRGPHAGPAGGAGPRAAGGRHLRRRGRGPAGAGGRADRPRGPAVVRRHPQRPGARLLRGLRVRGRVRRPVRPPQRPDTDRARGPARLGGATRARRRRGAGDRRQRLPRRRGDRGPGGHPRPGRS
ncbi:hypothetical protein SLAVM298S_07202 [Streptomyces lavendulae subsp. lavendulae]